MPPSYLITIDVEGDDQWASSPTVTTRNAQFLPRFQQLCERHRLRPTYLTNYEMAMCPVFREFGRDVLRRGVGEIGMHLHAWNNPPEAPLTPQDYAHHTYLIEYPEPVMREKVKLMTATLEDVFGVKMVSHRAGRWGFNETYARILIEQGYLVDCSVAPHTSYRHHKGAPHGNGGPDFQGFPEHAYLLDPNDIRKEGTSPLLEVPVTVRRVWEPVGRWLHRLFRNAPGKLRSPVNRLYPAVRWLRPRGDNLRTMLRLQQHVAAQNAAYAEFMLHSSELMPGGSPTFRTDESIERLYDDLEILFEQASRTFQGLTLGEIYPRVTAA